MGELSARVALRSSNEGEGLGEGWELAGAPDWLSPIGKDGHLPIRETHMLRAVP